MGLFALGTLSRYHPSFWNPFVTRDSTGEKLIVEKFISVARRQIPNLVLNLLEGEQISFVYQTGGFLDLTQNSKE